MGFRGARRLGGGDGVHVQRRVPGDHGGERAPAPGDQPAGSGEPQQRRPRGHGTLPDRGGILDCYAALRCVAEELSGRYDVDRDHVGVYGISSGGYLAAGVAMELARRRDAHLARLMIADVPAVSDHWVRPRPDPSGPGDWHWSQSEVERWHGTHGHIETLAMLAEDWERQVRERDPYLFPGTMGDDLLRHVPAHVVMTREFDFLRTDAELFASDLARHGKLLDYYVRPGVSHYTGPQPGVLKRIVDAYL